MNLPFWLEVLIALVLLVGGLFLLIGSVGLARLPDFFTRLHGPTKATTLGIGMVLLACMIHFSVQQGAFSVHELMITLFLFITAPLTAHMLAKAALHLELDVLERTRNRALREPARQRRAPDQ